VLTGTVTDDDGIALIGVSVYPENNTAAGTLTDIDGNFTLNITPEDERIVFSYVGYQRRTVPVNGRTSLNVRLSDNSETLQEVVVVAYGESKREDIVGAVDQVTSKEIEDLQVNSFDQALAGQVAGVQIRTGSGRPDGGAELLLRGVGTSGDNAPLIVIDGIPFGNYNAQNNNFLSLVNPNDIESVSVIRDASGKALYGSRAGNGLIIITTKRGRKGKPTISFNATSAIQVIPEFEKPDVLNATELARFLREREEDDPTIDPEDYNPLYDNPEQYGEGTDWYDLITRNGSRQNVDMSIRGGTDNVTYSFSGGYTHNEGVVKNTDFTRYTFRASLDAQINPWLKFGVNISPSQTESNVAGVDPGTAQFQAYHPLQVARWADPSAPAYDADGNLTQTTLGSLLPFYQTNPLFRMENLQATQLNRQVLSQFQLAATPVKGLQIKELFGVNLLFNRGRNFRPSSILGESLTPAINNDPQSRSSAGAGRYENLRLVSETTANYDRSFGDHNFGALAGYIVEWTQETFFNASGDRVFNEDFTLFNSGNIATFNPNAPEETRIFFNANESFAEQALVSYIGSLKYNYAQKYYLTANVRRDASSRFGPGLQAAIFPSLALAWRVSKEPWFRVGAISDLRFELSIGETGNNRIGNYEYQGDIGGQQYILGNALARGFSVTDLPNPFLAWEQIEQTDLGVELGLFQNRVNVEATYYRQTTNDLLFRAQLPGISGFGGIRSNIGSIRNTGVEFQIRTKPVVSDNFVWTLDANISHNRNEILQFGFDNTPIFQTQAGNGTRIVRSFPGRPVGDYYGLQITGLFTEEDLADADQPRYPGAVPGSPKYVDGDGDGVLEVEDDYVFLGNPFPDFNYGLTSFLTYRNFGLRIVGYGEQGGLIFDLAREIELNTDGVFNVRSEVKDRFRPGSTDFSLRVPTTETQQSSQRFRTPSSQGVIDGSFFKISNVALSYKFDELLQNVPAIRGLTATFSIQNALVFSEFRGNPEIGRASNAFERNINYNTYPSTRTFSFGLNLNL
jgi:TonB-linked SusC/RagA family outer membrane protein